jgi:hypothetical protein
MAYAHESPHEHACLNPTHSLTPIFLLRVFGRPGERQVLCFCRWITNPFFSPWRPLTELDEVEGSLFKDSAGAQKYREHSLGFVRYCLEIDAPEQRLQQHHRFQRPSPYPSVESFRSVGATLSKAMTLGK